MSRIFFVFVIISLLTTSKIVGQSISVGGIFPTIDHSGSLNKKFDYGLYYFAALPLINFKQPNISKDEYFHLLYLEQALTFKKSDRLSFTASYLYQRANVTSNNYVNENRLYLQTKYKHSLKSFTISHRFRFDGRFIKNRITNTIPFTHRFRYLIGFEKQLNEKTYFTGYEELFFNTTKASNPTFNENWGYVGCGRKINDQNKIELGILYVTWNLAKSAWFNQYYVQFTWINHLNFIN